MKIKAILISILLGIVSCSDDTRPTTVALGCRQHVVENFGPEVYDFADDPDRFLARCPDGSVWMVIVGYDWNTKKYSVYGRSQIFSENKISFPEHP